MTKNARDILENSHSAYTRTQDDQYRSELIEKCQSQLFEAMLEIVGPDLPTYAHDSKRWNDYLVNLRQKLRVFFDQPSDTKE